MAPKSLPKWSPNPTKIDEKIDVGMKVYLDTINIDKDDTIFDVDSKLFYLEMEHLNKILSEDFK